MAYGSHPHAGISCNCDWDTDYIGNDHFVQCAHCAELWEALPDSKQKHPAANGLCDCTWRTTEFGLSMMLVLARQRASSPVTPRALIVNISSRPSSTLAAASGCWACNCLASPLSFAFPLAGLSLNACVMIQRACWALSLGSRSITFRSLWIRF